MNMHDLFTSWTMRLQIKWVSDVTNIMKYPISCDRVFKNIFCNMKNVLFIITQIDKKWNFYPETKYFFFNIIYTQSILFLPSRAPELNSFNAHAQIK